MSLPARKQPGASRRRKKQAVIRRFQQRLLQAATGTAGQSILKDVQATIAAMHRDRQRKPWP